MKYLELKVLCKTCIGCNLEEIPYFTGKTECNNYVKANEAGLECCKKIIEGIQMRL